MASQRRIDFYFDFVSPYAYLGWFELRRLQKTHGFVIDPKPVLFAGLLNAHGTLGPAEVDAKRRFVFVDSLRKAALLNIPLHPPFGHPFNPLLALRLILAADPGQRHQLIDHLFRATWELGIEVSTREPLQTFLDSAEAPPLDLAAVWQRAQSDEIKLALRTATTQAVNRGVFGVPTFLLKGDMYWGVDNLVHLEAALRGRQFITEEQTAAWGRVKPTAQRKPS